MTSNFELKPFPDGPALAAAAAKDWLALVKASPAQHTVALSGGRITKDFFAAIVNLAKESGGLLGNVDFFWADERCLPPTDPESNFLLARENLFQPLCIAQDRIHRLKGDWLPMAAVSEAIQDIRRVAAADGAGIPVLDMVFLGMGEDGHIASLMPNATPAALASREPYVHVSNSPKPPPDRLSLTYPMLAAARNVWVLAAGTGKAEALKTSISPGGSTPLARVLQSRQRTVIYTDISV
ncbi:MAG TPA: 6-phosphogluconolactonase [Verrucomicrobiae bacterium]|jgi:6-phosphogluconolactonase